MKEELLPQATPVPPRAWGSWGHGGPSATAGSRRTPFPQNPSLLQPLEEEGEDVHSLWAFQGLESPLEALSPGSVCHTLVITCLPSCAGPEPRPRGHRKWDAGQLMQLEGQGSPWEGVEFLSNSTYLEHTLLSRLQAWVQARGSFTPSVWAERLLGKRR